MNGRMPPWRKYSTSFGVSIRAITRNVTCELSAAVVRTPRAFPGVRLSAMPPMSNNSVPDSPSVSRVWRSY